MANVVEPGPFPPEAAKMFREVLALCEGKDVQTITNVLANAMLIVVAATGEFSRFRAFMSDMIDAHELSAHQKAGTVPQS